MANGPFRAPSALCVADLATTLARLQARDEPPESVEWHTRYMERYLHLAARWGALILRTDQHNEEESLALLVEWARREVAAQRGATVASRSTAGAHQ